MKIRIIFLIVFRSFFSFFLVCGFFLSDCSSLEKQSGSIGKQVDLVEDLLEKLPAVERPRYKKFLENVREEERKMDNTIEQMREAAITAKLEAAKSSGDAGKWYGIRNMFLGLMGFAIVSLAGYVIIKLGLIKIPVLG